MVIVKLFLKNIPLLHYFNHIYLIFFFFWFKETSNTFIRKIYERLISW